MEKMQLDKVQKGDAIIIDYDARRYVTVVMNTERPHHYDDKSVEWLDVSYLPLSPADYGITLVLYNHGKAELCHPDADDILRGTWEFTPIGNISVTFKD